MNSRPVKRQNFKKTNPEGRLWILACILIGLFIVALVFLKKEGAKIPHNPAVDETSQPKAVAKKTASTPQPRFDFYTILPKGQTSSAATATTAAPAAQVQQERAPAPAVPPPTPPDLNTSSDQPAPSAPVAPAAASSPVAEDDMASTSPAHSNADTDATSKPTANAKDEVEELEKQQLASESQSSSSSTVTDKAVTTSYVIQLGIFKDFTAADQLKAQLAMQGVEAKIKNIKKSNTVYYRVWIGPYTNHTDATNKQQDLKNNQIKSSVVKDTN